MRAGASAFECACALVCVLVPSCACICVHVDIGARVVLGERARATPSDVFCVRASVCATVSLSVGIVKGPPKLRRILMMRPV